MREIPLVNQMYGLTGEAGRDGLLTVEQYARLNEIQLSAARSSRAYLNNMQPGELFPLVAMATGFGKGKIIHHVLEQELRENLQARVLVLAGTRGILVDQTHMRLNEYQKEVSLSQGTQEEDSDEADEDVNRVDDLQDELSEFRSVLYRTGGIDDSRANVHVATLQTLQSRMKRELLDPSMYDLVIVDEVHNIGTKDRIQAINQFRRVVGFTATPLRSSGDYREPEEYGFKVIENLPLPQAQEEGFLPPLIGMQIDTSSLVGRIPTDTTGRINYKKLEQQLKANPNLRPYLVDRISEIISSDGKAYKTIIAVNWVWEAQEISELLKNKGISVGIAVNETAARELHTEEIPALDSIERYHLPHGDERSIQVVVSPRKLGEGFDAPFTEVLVWASPTDSDNRYSQYTGRLARRFSGKQFGVVVDCLYQLSQYRWSHNFGMWMKGHIKELENGLLWLGPEDTIDKVRALPQVEAMRQSMDAVPLMSLDARGLLPVQLTDFPLTWEEIDDVFLGSSRKKKRTADEIVNQLVEVDANLMTYRWKHNQTIRVVTDRDRFINEMIARGILRKEADLQPVQSTDIALTHPSMLPLFVGQPKDTLAIARDVLDEARASRPEVIARRSTMHSGPVEVIADRDWFIEKMQERGVRLKESESPQVRESEFAVTNRNLASRFVLRDGGTDGLVKLANEVIEQMQQEDPDSIVTRRSGARTIQAVTNQARFEESMLAGGAETRLDLDKEIAEGKAFPLSQLPLIQSFIGAHDRIRPIAETIADELAAEDSNLVVPHVVRGRQGTIRVVRDRSRFETEMVKKGIQQRIASEPLLTPLPTDFKISARDLMTTFIGDYKQLRPIKDVVKARIEAENPNLIAERKSGTNRVTVCTDKTLFTKYMLEAGASLRDSEI